MSNTNRTISFPHLREHLLWEYDAANFNYFKSASIVIERVILRGNMEEWKEIIRFYGKEIILEVNETSKQLDNKHKKFTKLFLESEYNAL